MSRVLLNVAACIVGMAQVWSAQSEVIISEYVEASSYNKAIELYNMSESPVDLGLYALEIYFNGEDTPAVTIELSGTLAGQQTYVIGNARADAALQTRADYLTNSLSFNGDDAVRLAASDKTVDCVGRVGEDPGSQWGSGNVSTRDNTIRRRLTVTRGDTNHTDAFDPSREWEGFPNNTFSGLGTHGATEPGEGCTVFHINDMHGRLTPHDFDIPEEDDQDDFVQVGGAACLTAKLMELKSAQPHSLIVDGGDISEGNPLGDLRGNGAMVDYLNALDSLLKSLGGRGIDAVVAGNHDVREREYLTNMLDADFPVVSVNICRKGTQTPYFDPYVIVDVADTKVGIVGFTHDDSLNLGPTTEPIVDVVKCVWDDNSAETIDIKEYVNTLRNTHSCDLVILLAHVGQSRLCSGRDALLEDDVSVKVPEIAITGHWHSVTETAWLPSKLNGKTLVAEAGSYMAYVGELKVDGQGTYVSATKHVVTCADVSPNPRIESLVQGFVDEYESGGPVYALDDTIGYSAVDLRMDKDKWWTANEYPWSGDNTAGAWICDAMQWQVEQIGLTCDCAMQSGGGVRRDVPAGPVTYMDIYETYPWSDDYLVRVSMTGRQIRDYIEDDYCGTSISHGWRVFASDGIIDSVLYDGQPLDLARAYTVAVSQYMFEHHDDGPFPGSLLGNTHRSIRQGVIDYTSQFTEDAPMQVPGPRYVLDTELAGEFDAVVTMTADSESEPYYEAIFVRLLSATPMTVAQRGTYTPRSLVNEDGTVNRAHQFSESMVYRSHLGYEDGLLQPGDIIRIRVEGGFHAGNPQLVDQEGIISADSVHRIIGHDSLAALPEDKASISAFWDDFHENHLVRFHATKTGQSTVEDANGMSITIYQEGGYYRESLPGDIGDLLVFTGVNTYRYDERRFRCRDVAVSDGPPTAVATYHHSGPRVPETTPYEPAGRGSAAESTSWERHVVRKRRVEPAGRIENTTPVMPAGARSTNTTPPPKRTLACCACGHAKPARIHGIAIFR